LTEGGETRPCVVTSAPRHYGASLAYINAGLTIEDVPGIDAEWAEIAEFALTFPDAYDVFGGFMLLSTVANHVRQKWFDGDAGGLLFEGEWAVGNCMPTNLTLTDLRCLLYFEQRRARWTETVPTGQELRYVRALVAAIAQQVKGGRND
jgi:hypothetical protein